MEKQKLIIITGPTATGKSDLAVILAKEISGEVISADSRQVYRGLDIGSGKITREEMRGIPHHLIDIANPGDQFSVSDFKKLGEQAIANISSRGNIPIICGGTGFYISALVDNISLPAVLPNQSLRTELARLSTEELMARLQILDPDRAETVDPDNPVRIIRAIEIATALGSVPKLKSGESPYDVLMIGLTLPDEVLRTRIYDRLARRIDEGMISEVKDLHAKGASWEWLEHLGLEYKYVSLFLQDKITREEMIKTLGYKIWQFAKRQMTWWKRDLRITWFNPATDQKKIIDRVQNFLTS